jgi:hypothetical protein
MSRIGTSTFDVTNIFIDTSAYRGNTGATGPQGNTGPDGISGSTGNTGLGVSYILYTNSDGITVYLTDSSTIDVFGLSGNTFTEFTSTALDIYYKLSGTTGTIPNQSFEIKGVVSGLTATFKSIQWIGGFTSSYSGNDLIISGVTISGGYALGSFGSVLRSDGNTAAVFPSSIFKYEENTVGLTTTNIAKVVIAQFNQSDKINNKNINSLSSRIDDYLGYTANIAFQQYQIGTHAQSKINQTTIFSENTKIGETTGPKRIFRQDIAFNKADGLQVTFSPYVYGSCCFCDGQGRPRCLDYVNPSVCSGLQNGVYSENSCSSRRTGNCRDVGKCCLTNGKCVDVDNFTCNRIGGTFNRNQICSGDLC